jgi:uncharacterized membrane protein
MTIVDHRILIPRPPGLIWELISDLNRNPDWIVDCTRVAYVTPRHTGTGVRWRHTTERGKDVVLETTAWYDGLGYEYTFIDGAPYKESKGRIRLQEVPEGTIVQWTFNYEAGGLFANVKNAVSDRRRIEAQIIDSLKNLWRLTSKAGADGGFAARSAMRDAPDYEARSQYRPRHAHARSETQETLPVVPLVIEEPPVKQEDTRPRPAVQIPADTPEPTFLSALPPTSADLPESASSTGEKRLETGTLPATAPLTAPADGPSLAPSSVLSVKDTAEVSVFDLFGVPRPSQTQPMAPVVVEDDAPAAAQLIAVLEAAPPITPAVEAVLAVPATVPTIVTVTSPRREGYRKTRRRQRVRLRLPA